jgi:hypothetical protein
MMSRRKPSQWVKDWWEAFNDGLYVLWPMVAIAVIVILIVYLMSQK